MEITGKQSVVVEIDEKDLGRTLIGNVLNRLGGFDDAGCDWYTDKNGGIYVGGGDWKVAQNIELKSMVDAGNFLLYGKILTLDI